MYIYIYIHTNNIPLACVCIYKYIYIYTYIICVYIYRLNDIIMYRYIRQNIKNILRYTMFYHLILYDIGA